MNLGNDQTLWKLTQGYRLRYGAAILVLWLSIVLLFGVPLVLQEAIDGVLRADEGDRSGWLYTLAAESLGGVDPVDALWAAAACIALLTLVGGTLQYFRGRWAATASEEIVQRLRDRLYGHLDRLPASYHDRVDTGDLVQRCTSDVETVRAFLSVQVVEIGRAVLLLATALPILFWLDWRMALVSLALFPLIILFAVVFFRRVKALFQLTDEAEGEMTTVLQENLTGIRVVRAFARQEHECEKFAAKNALFRDRNARLIRLLGVYWASSDILCLAQMGLSLVVGAWWAQRSDFTVGELFAFAEYLAMLIWPVRHMGRVLSETGKAVVSLGRLRQVLDENEESDREGAADAGRLEGDIELRDVTFAYGAEEPALRGMSFRVRPGETLALLGPPGSGKSTIVHLLLRLYDDFDGSIRVDGRDIRELSRGFVRSQIGVVLQEPFLYSKTLDANVRLGRPEATRDEVVAATSAACIHESIEDFESGYETLVGERGVTLSGGQRQRVAIARALLERPSVLVLDDALSAVDTGTEAHILEALRRRRGKQTTVLIAHRLSSLQHADRILVLEEGRVVQSGSHRELVAMEGPYRRLWRIQGALENEIDRDLALTGSEVRRR